MPTGEITLRDLVAWTDLVSADDASPHGPDDPLERDVDWVITARATAPMLPTLRGGELVLLPERVVNESALNLQMLIGELTSQPVAGVVLDTTEPVRSSVPVLRTAKIGIELESDLNRMLTTRRGEMLRTGADIERIISTHRTAHTTPTALLENLAEHLGYDLAVRTAGGSLIVATTPDPPDLQHADAAGWVHRELPRRRVLLLGTVTPETHAVGRFVLGRIAEAVHAALDEEASTAHDLETRTRLVNGALAIATVDPVEAGSRLRRAGIPPDAPFHIAIARPGSADRDVWPLLRGLGTPVDAGEHVAGPAWLLTGPASGHPAGAVPDDAWVAVSGPVTTSAELAAAMRELVFLAGARGAGVIGGSVIRADDLAQLGVVRLLYEVWGTPLLAEYVETLVGELLREDRRGQLRTTLRAYLAFGGSQRVTAEHLGIHRNTLAYRLRQIRGLLGADPDDPASRLSLHLALIASELPPAEM
jgi:purine catabolism regulator